MPKLEGSLRSWVNMYGMALSIISVISIASMFVYNTRTTTLLANETATEVVKLKDGAKEREWRINGHDKAIIEIKASIDKFTCRQEDMNNALILIKDKLGIKP